MNPPVKDSMVIKIVDNVKIEPKEKTISSKEKKTISTSKCFKDQVTFKSL